MHKNLGGKKEINTYFKNIVDSLMYLIATQLGIMHVVSLISRYMEKPTELYLIILKRIFAISKELKTLVYFIKKKG